MAPLLNFLRTFSPSPREGLNSWSFQPRLPPSSGHTPAYSLWNLRADKLPARRLRMESASPAVKAQNKVEEGTQPASARN